MALDLLHPDDRALVQRVTKSFESGKDHHEAFRRKANRFYAKYRSYRDFKRDYSQASRDQKVDELLRETAGPFGTNLFIPYCFATIESTLPRMLAQNPKMQLTPADERTEQNIDNTTILLDRQQSKISYPLVLQDIGKCGLMYGIGWGKTYWQEGPQGKRPMLQPGVTTSWTADGTRPKRGYQGPMAEALDPFDVIWDPVAHNVQTCRWIIHRQWRDNAFVKMMVDSHEWELPTGVKLEDLLNAGSDQGRDEVWRDRQRASGYDQPDRRGDHLHEVWEFHDAITGEVITILDRQTPVAVAANPYWHGCLPFQVFRPTRVPFEMVGIGEIEAIEDLQEEINVLRSQRRDNAAIVLQRPYFYFDGLLDPNDFVFGPGKAIPVDGDPRNVIFPAPLQDIPASGYQEEAQLQQDIWRTSGMDDTVAGAGSGGGGASETATGAQLVTAAAGIRIQAKTKNIQEETVKQQAVQFIELNQQFIVDEVTVPGPPRPDEGDKHYSFYRMGPGELAGEWDDVTPVDGSMSPTSKIERQQRAKDMYMTLGQNPMVNPRKLTEHMLEDGYEIQNPEGTGWLAPEEPQVPPQAIELASTVLAQKYGVPPQEFQELIAEATQQVEVMQQGGDPAQGDPSQQPQEAGQPEPVPA